MSRKRRLNVYLTDKMYKDLEKVSAEMGLSMSAVMILSFHNFMQQSVVVPNIEKMLELMEDNP